MRTILKFAALAVSIILATPAFAGGVGCFGRSNCNGGGGDNGGGHKTWRHNGNGQKMWHNGGGNQQWRGFKFRRQPPPDVIVNNGGGQRRWHQGDGRKWRDQNSGRTIIKQYFPQQGGGYYDDYGGNYRHDDGTNVILGLGALGVGIGIIDALNHQPSPPPDYYDQPYDEPLPQRRYVEPNPGLDVFPDLPPLKAAPAPQQKVVTNRKKADKAVAKSNSDSHTTINNNIVIVTKDGAAPAAITTDADGNVVTLEEACKAKNGTYYLGTDGLPKCDL